MSIADIEATIGGWYKQLNLPHLPIGVRTWLVDNVWWLVLIVAVIDIFGFAIIVPEFITSIVLTFTFGAISTVFGVTNHANTLVWFGIFISTLGYILATAVLVASISYLRAKTRKGWRYLFLAYFLNFGFGILSSIVTLHISNALGQIISALVTGYFLYEIREYFVTAHKPLKASKKAKVIRSTKKS